MIICSLETKTQLQFLPLVSNQDTLLLGIQMAVPSPHWLLTIFGLFYGWKHIRV